MAQKLGDLFFELQLSDKQLNSELNRVEKGVRKTGTRAGKTFGGSFWAWLKNVAPGIASMLNPVTLWITAVTVGLKKSLDVFKEFEKTMSEVKAISWATEEQFVQLENKAKELWATTEYSASQVWGGLVFLSRAWLTAREQLVAIGPALDLATAANIDLAKSADIATNIMSQFWADISELPHVIDVLSATTSSANTDMLQLSEAMKYAGPTAKALWIPLEEISAAIGVLGNNGLQGSLATRALGTSLTRLAKPTVAMQAEMDKLGLKLFDQQGNFVGISDTIKQLETSFVWMTNEQKQAALTTLFGAEAIQEMNILLAAGSDELSRYTEELINSDWKTAEMADTMRDNLQGSINNLKSAFEGLGIAIWETAQGGFRFLVDGVTFVVRAVTGLVEWFERLKNKVTVFINESTFLTNVLATIRDAFHLVVDAVSTTINALDKLANKLGIGNDYTKQYSKSIKDLWNKINKAKIELEKLNVAYASWTIATEEYDKRRSELNETIKEAQAEQDKLIAIDKQQQAINEERKSLLSQINNIMQDWNATLEEKNERSTVLRNKLAQLEAEEKKLQQTSKLLNGEMSVTSESLNSIQTAQSRAEFERLKKKQLELIYSDYQLLKAEEAKMKAFFASGQISEAEYTKFLSTAIKSTKQLKAVYQEAKNIEYTGWVDGAAAQENADQTTKALSGVSKAAKKAADEQIALIEEKAKAEKARIIDEEKDEEKAAAKIQKLDEDTEIKKLELQGKTADAALKRAEQEQRIRKDIGTLYEGQEKEIQDDIDDSIDKLEDYQDEIKKVEEAYADMGKKAKEEIYDVNKALADSWRELANDLASRYVEVWDQLEELQKKTDRSPGDNARIQELKAEQALIKENVSAEEIAEAQRVAGLSESEQILENYEKEMAALDEKKRLLEQVAAASAAGTVTQQFEVRKSDTWVLEAYAKDSEGVFQKITDDKNAEYIIDTVNQANELEKQKTDLQAKIDHELFLQTDLNTKKKELEDDWLNYLAWAKKQETDMATELYNKRLQVYNMRSKATGWGGEVTSRASGGPLAKGQTSFVSEKGLELFKSWNNYSLLSPGLFTPETNGQVLNAQKTKDIINKSVNLWGLTINGQNVTGLSEKELERILNRFMESQLDGVDRYR